MTLRLRLTLGYLLVFVTTLCLGSSLIYYATARTLQHNLDDSLQETATIVRASIDWQRGRVSLEPKLRAGPDIQVQLLGAQGQVLDQIGQVTAPAISLPLQTGTQSWGQLRSLTQTVPGPQPVYLRVFRSTESLSEFLETLFRMLLLGGMAMTALAGGTGYWLATRALKPLGEVARTAQTIAEKGDYTQRVLQSPGQDELAQLTATVNSMLDRLSGTIEHEKQFARIASHELRTPLTTLKGRLDLTLERERSAADYVRALQGMRERVETLSSMSESLLALAHTDGPVQLERVELAGAALRAHEAIEDLAQAQGKQIHLDLSESWVWAESEGVVRVISNLLDNALKYGQGLHVSLGVQGGEVTVKNAGTGPAEAQWSQLLQPFARGRGLQHVIGSGLGLALVDSLCRRWQAVVYPQWTGEIFQVTVRFPVLTSNPQD